MDDPQNLESQSLKDRPWTTEEIRKHSSNWTLAGDVGLYNLLNEFSHQIISRTHEVENAVDSLVHQTKMTTAKINNVINDFHMLSNLQFVENRVYDEEIQEPVTENKPVAEKTKEKREAEMLPKIIQAIELGLAVLDTAFDRINVNEISDSEDEEDISSEGRTILEPKDPYENRPLPFIIGSEEFMKCDYAGLKDLIEDDAHSLSEESSISETDETSSDEGEPLPLDDDRFSEKQIDNVSQNISGKISSSDESELFGSDKEANSLGSESSLEIRSKEKNIQRIAETLPEKVETRKISEKVETRKISGSVSSLQSKLKLPQVLPVSKVQEKNEDDLFANEDQSDDESPFRKRTGLFTSDLKFKEEKDDDLFGGDLFGKSQSEDIREVKHVEVPQTAPKKPPSSVLPDARKPTLFDNDEDSEDDIFNTLMKTKKPTTTKTSNAGSQDSSEKADTTPSLSTPSSAPSTKPSGNAFDFVTGAGNTDSLFGDDSDADDLFSSKKISKKKFDFDSSENEDLFDTINSKAPKDSKVLGETESSLFEDNKILDEPKKKETEKEIKKKAKPSLFEESDSSDQEKQIVKSPVSIPTNKKKEINLFGDDDLEEDIFSTVAKVTKPSKPVEKSKPSSLFDNSEVAKSKESQPVKSVEKSKSISLFDDTEEESTEILSSASKGQQSKLSSLFDESDSFDLFAPKPSVKESVPVEPSIPKKVPKPATESPKQAAVLPKLATESPKQTAVLPKPAAELPKQAAELPKPVVTRLNDEIDGNVTTKKSSPAKDANINNQVSFDTPAASSNLLNSINKSRVKVPKRRKPTRQGRLAALENSEKEVQADSTVISAKSDSTSAVGEDSDSLFSTSVTKTTTKSESPKLDYKSQEKKKMNLMSQLISEVAVSKITLRKSAEKEVEDEDDDVNLFSEASKKDSSKGSFSFKTPEENGISSMFPIEKKEEKDDLNLSKSDSLEDDFFTEPAFQNFRSSISHKDPVLDLEDDDDDDDDLFSAIKSNVLPKIKKDSSDSNELFGDDTDIFADVQKEKYEMFPSQVFDEDDDIFSNVNNTVANKSAESTSKTSNSSSVKKVETKQVNAFDDPLTGLLGE